jgi:hypothetical protein
MARVSITPLRLRVLDKLGIAELKHLYGLSSLADSVRVSSRVVSVLGLAPEKVAKLNAQYETDHPEAVHIEIAGIPSKRKQVRKTNPNA